MNLEDLKFGNRYILQGTQPKYPISSVTGAKILDLGGNSPVWMDDAGVIWGANYGTNFICKSEDYGESYTDVLEVTGGFNQSIVMITNSGKILTVDGSGNILLSNAAKTSFTTKGTFAGGGGARQQFASCKRGDVIILGEYGSESAINPKKQVWASWDDGENFELIFNPTLSANEGDEEFIHIHDVEFDPWTHTVWVCSGDTGAKNIWYSHDFGGTWVDFYGDRPQAQRAYQPTQIWAFPFGILFGTDERPDGFRLLPKDPSVMQPNYNYADLIPNWTRLDDSETMSHIFNKRWTSYLDDGPLYLMPVAGNAGGFSRILASRDGLFWCEIHRFQTGTGQLRTIVGPDPNDAERRIIGSLDFGTDNYKTFIAKVPDWI